MTPKDLMNEKKLSALEEAAKTNTHIHYIDEIYRCLYGMITRLMNQTP